MIFVGTGKLFQAVRTGWPVQGTVGFMGRLPADHPESQLPELKKTGRLTAGFSMSFYEMRRVLQGNENPLFIAEETPFFKPDFFQPLAYEFEVVANTLGNMRV
ncbi:hypothetical protein HMPREF1207_01480 [Paenibacillus sp. HGH0039]|nr:hypothetical protein HMPREF1207_01480 [Paenibacillus sp. HGH0039]